MQEKKTIKLFPIPLVEKVVCKAVRRSYKGFTLIELLVVVLIIGILAAVVVPQYQLAVLKSRVTQAAVRAEAITKAEEIYYLSTGHFTNSLADLDVDFADCSLRQDYENTYYKCTDKVNLDIFTYSVYAYVLENKTFGLEYGFKNKYRRCFAAKNFVLGNKVCENLGGTVFYNEGPIYYDLP